MGKNRHKQNKKMSQSLQWHRLDNTANLFPVIVSENVSNVYRVSVTLKEQINPEILQKALDKVLPFFKVFSSKLKKGIFWYYFETNTKSSPRVIMENSLPCQYINPYANNEYQFRVTYYEKRINLEVFHALTDGNGALAFLKEITYQYLRYCHEELMEQCTDTLSPNLSLDKVDGYIKNYKSKAKKNYNTKKAYVFKGEKFDKGIFGIIHGYMNLKQVKQVAKEHNVTINQYLLGVYAWAVYKACFNQKTCKNAFSVCVPVNLRPYFETETTKNFFTVVSAIFESKRDDYTFDEVLAQIAASLNEQINKENLEKMFSYNVASEKNMLIRVVPVFVKNLVMKYIYKTSARANSTTVTNLGLIKVADEYKDYIDKFHIVLSISKGQYVKGGVCSFDNVLVFTFSSVIIDTSLQREFFRKISEDGIEVSIESNGVYYE